MLRHIFPDLPVVVIGHAMVRRCLSVVAVDLLAQHADPLLAVTHMVVHSGGNGADLAQQFLRPSTTLTAFHRHHNIQSVQMLATQLVWDVVSAMQAFTEWRQFDTATTSLDQRPGGNCFGTSKPRLWRPSATDWTAKTCCRTSLCRGSG